MNANRNAHHTPPKETAHPIPGETKPLTTANTAPANGSLTALTFETPSEGDAYAAAVDGGFIAVVEVSPDRYRRRAFLTLAAAERCVRNARARGQSARIVLAHLAPLYILAGTAQGELPTGGEQG